VAVGGRSPTPSRRRTSWSANKTAHKIGSVGSFACLASDCYLHVEDFSDLRPATWKLDCAASDDVRVIVGRQAMSQ